MIELITGSWQVLDILVNNAGVVSRGGLLDVTEAMWDHVVDVNLKGVFLCTQSAARWMKPRGTGAIINITSGGFPASNNTAVGCLAFLLPYVEQNNVYDQLRVNWDPYATAAGSAAARRRAARRPRAAQMW